MERTFFDIVVDEIFKDLIKIQKEMIEALDFDDQRIEYAESLFRSWKFLSYWCELSLVAWCKKDKLFRMEWLEIIRAANRSWYAVEPDAKRAVMWVGLAIDLEKKVTGEANRALVEILSRLDRALEYQDELKRSKWVSSRI